MRIGFSVLDMLEIIWRGNLKVWRGIAEDVSKRGLDVLEHATALRKVQHGEMTYLCETD